MFKNNLTPPPPQSPSHNIMFKPNATMFTVTAGDATMNVILRYTVSRDNGFRFVTHELFDCCVQVHNDPSLSVILCRCE